MASNVFAFGMAAVAALALTPAHAQVPGTDGAPEVANGAATPPNDRVICRTSKVIGSRLKGARVCKTAKQWEADQMEQRAAVEKGQNQRTTAGQ